MRITSLSAILLWTALAHAQNIPDDTVNFQTVDVFNDLKRCLKAVFANDYAINTGPVQRVIGCDTNDCLCRPDTLEQAVTTAGSMALSQCSNSNDKLSATSILTQYCSEHYTGVVNIALPTDGSDASSRSTTAGRSTVIVQTSVNSIVATISGSATTVFSTVISSATQTSSPSKGSADDPKPVSAGPIAGGVIGGVLAIAAIVGLIFWFLRRKKQSNGYAQAEQGVPPNYQQSHPGGYDRESKMVGGIQESSYRPQ